MPSTISVSVALRDAWRSTLLDLGIDAAAAVVVGGPPAEAMAESGPMAIGDEVRGLASLGPGPVLPTDATPAHTGLESGTIGAAVMLGAWSSVGELDAVAAEAVRIVVEGGTVHLGRPDLDALLNATATTHRSAVLYGPRAAVIRGAIVPGRGVSSTELALVRRGLSPIDVTVVDLPVGAFADADAYVAAIEAGMWPGWNMIDAAGRADVRSAVRRMLNDTIFPLVERQPWVVASARVRS